MSTDKLIDRFIAKTKKMPNGCIEWQASRNERGYGQLAVGNNGKSRCDRAHRVSYRLFVGDITNGLYVCHNCDNPACVRPSHLFLGTHQENMIDMTAKGRGRPTGGKCKGRRHWGAKLNDDDVIAIRAMYATGRFYQAKIAEMFGVQHTAISAIVLRQKWSHI